MSSSLRTRMQICRNSSSITWLNAFMASGRFSVPLATGSPTSNSTVGAGSGFDYRRPLPLPVAFSA
jgi:hypothetical protein